MSNGWTPSLHGGSKGVRFPHRVFTELPTLVCQAVLKTVGCKSLGDSTSSGSAHASGFSIYGVCSMSIKDVVSQGIEQKTAYYTDYPTLVKIIELYFDLQRGDYELIALEEVGSLQGAADWEINVQPRLPDKYCEKVIEDVKNKKPKQWGTRTILNYLCYHGVIPAGDYIIDVSW